MRHNQVRLHVIWMQPSSGPRSGHEKTKKGHEKSISEHFLKSSLPCQEVATPESTSVHSDWDHQFKDLERVGDKETVHEIRGSTGHFLISLHTSRLILETSAVNL